MARLVLFLSAVVTLLVTPDAALRKDLPPYIKPCKRSDPQVSECVRGAILALRPQLSVGIPDIDVPAIEPLLIPQLRITPEGSTLKLRAVDVRLYGVGQVDIPRMKVHINETSLIMDLDLFIPTFRLETEYQVSGSIFSLPIRGTGPLHVNLTDVSAYLRIEGKLHARKSATWLRFYDGALNVKDIGSMTLQLENLFNGDKTLGDATNAALNDNTKELLSLVLPDVEKTILEFVLNTGNSIGAQFSWDQLALP